MEALVGGAQSPRNASDALRGDERLRAARAVLVEHVTDKVTGRCAKCDSFGTCWRRENAVVAFSRTLRLPASRPGSSAPEAIGAVRAGCRPVPMVGQR